MQVGLGAMEGGGAGSHGRLGGAGEPWKGVGLGARAGSHGRGAGLGAIKGVGLKAMEGGGAGSHGRGWGYSSTISFQ